MTRLDPNRHWQTIGPLAILLFPLSLLFRAIVTLRRTAYRVGLLRQ